MMGIDRTVRRSQTITPFGVGGIYDFGSESFVGMDTSKWKVKGSPDLRLPRLERVLKVEGFRAAPIAGRSLFPGAYRSGISLPYFRFPSWLFCPNCRSMKQWFSRMEEEGEHPYCEVCGKKSYLVPMRFMAVCKKGHLADIPWGIWAHIGSDKKCDNHRLQFKSEPNRGAGLQSLVIECVNCNSKNDLERLPFKDSLAGVMKACPGKHPWQKSDFAEPCDQLPQVVQRGASNAYYPIVESAIDIRVGDKKEDSLFDLIRLHPSWQPLVDLKDHIRSHDDPTASIFINKIVADDNLQKLGVTAEIVWKCLVETGTDEGITESRESNDDRLLFDEWSAFITPPESLPGAEFIAERANLESFSEKLPKAEKASWEEFKRLIAQITLAKKLRIVRALKGFTRLEPNYENLVTPSLGSTVNWLPANEIYGEGIFIALDPEALNKWEIQISNQVLAGMRNAKKLSTLGFLPEATDRFVLLHTLSHILIRQLCFECGYSSSSLSERIYSDEKEGMAGILIYTASADSEGALGGLVKEGLPERLYGTFKTALFRAGWCSNDPICSELEQQGVQGLNKSACHACTLVAETSCDHANSLLDRSVIIGTKSAPKIGYFNHMLSLIEGSV
ncbi:DrmB family protein [Idiomarina sp. HB]|uniref:DrmB family protein n=1 Tax=Idiomarina sp. HB TaxID=3110479 RepID=UPI003A7F666D